MYDVVYMEQLRAINYVKNMFVILFLFIRKLHNCYVENEWINVKVKKLFVKVSWKEHAKSESECLTIMCHLNVSNINMIFFYRLHGKTNLTLCCLNYK